MRTISEHAGKAALGAFGLPVPRSQLVPASQAATAAAAAVGFPVVIKATGAGLEHKTEVGGVVLGVRNAEQAAAAGQRLAALSDDVLVEQMIDDGVAEILVGVTVDEQFGQLLVLGAGGVQAEIWQDTVTLLPPWSRECHRRGAASGSSVCRTARRLSRPAGRRRRGADRRDPRRSDATRPRNRDTLVELDVNPLIVRPRGAGAVAVDVLIRMAEEP